jgi:NADH:ubiquinone oxidoreductase subunit 6 (subunit J)
MSGRMLRILLVVLDGFLGLTAIAGGVGLLAGINAPSTADLAGSLFSDYTIPALALLVIVGGAGVVSTVMTLRKHRYAALASGAAGVVILIFEIVEVLAIGSPPGVARTLQIFYFALGLLIILLALALWSSQRRSLAAG